VRVLRLATRRSALAQWQASHVAALLERPTRLVLTTPRGDRDKTTPLNVIDEHGLFVKEVQAAVLDGTADIAVHAAKDLPSTPRLQPAGLTLAAVPRRGNPSDVLVGKALSALAEGATVATGSPRRRVQLQHLRPDLSFVDLRGNLPTRLRRVPRNGSIITALAALERLGLEHRIADVLNQEAFIPQVGQGALAVECRSNDEEALGALARIQHGPSRLAIDAERAWLAFLGEGCDSPVAANATVDGRVITLTAMLASGDGSTLLTKRSIGTNPVEVGTRLAREMVATDPSLSAEPS